ncbi:MAG: septum formation initiator [Bacteroidetes bacterium MedPE-SWsnd-G2]|nr:MAG: septum formation initiator [Bacteroidetes bacterium MedPE-SWsnd-G2]
MSWKKSPFLKPFKNIYFLAITLFAVWMIFWDANSWSIHNELNTEMENLETEKAYYLKEIEKDNKALKELSTEAGIEKHARETYYMKKDNEEIYLIEYEDSIAKSNTNE